MKAEELEVEGREERGKKRGTEVRG